MLSIPMKIYCKNKNFLDAMTQNTFQLTPICFLEQVRFVIGSKMPSPSTNQEKVDTIRSFVHIFPRMTEQQLCIVFPGLISSINSPRRL